MQLIPPQPELRRDVECAIVVRRPAGSVSRFPAMPRAMLTWAARPAGGGTVSFHAISTRAVTHQHALPLHALGLVLPADTAARLLGMSSGALVDTTLPWCEVAGPSEALRLDEAMHTLQQRGGDAAMLAALQASLLRVLSRRPERLQHARAQALQQLCLCVGQHGTQAAGALGLGERQLERRCRALLGLSPKTLQRITRLHGLLCAGLQGQHVPDVSAALDAGYYDQSHMARDMRLLAGVAWRELLPQSHADGAWWPLHSQRLLAQSRRGGGRG